MSITSKIALSALLLGASLPAFAQGSVTHAVSHAVPHATTSSHALRAHKISSPVEATKPVAAKPVAAKPAPIAGTVTGTVAKPDTTASKIDTGKTAPAAGIAKSGVATPAPLPAVKTN